MTKKMINLALDNGLIDKIVAQMNEMKTNHNRIIKLDDPRMESALIITHVKREKTNSEKKVAENKEKKEE